MTNQTNDVIRDAKQLGIPKMLILGLQHMFAMFGATILVPIEAVRKYEELLSYAQGGFILPYHSGAGMIGYYYSPIPLVK